jgi:hypothetical protein
LRSSARRRSLDPFCPEAAHSRFRPGSLIE